MKEFSYRSVMTGICVTLSSILLTVAVFSSSSPSNADAPDTCSVGCTSAAPSLDGDSHNNSSISALQLASSAVPDRLETFTEQTITDLAEHLPFKNWQDASLDYTPLGPGTHSWLITIDDGVKPLGYLIITSDDLGGYILSEYGIGSELPYSLAPLKNTLASAGILNTGQQKDSTTLDSLPQGSKLEAQYNSITPYWKVTLKGKAPVYVHAVTNDIVPSAANKAPFPSRKTNIKSSVLSSLESLTSSSVINTQGEQDPYSNLKWLTNPVLSVKNGNDFIRLLRSDSRKSLIFTTKDQNAAFGAPFNLTGWQTWSPKDKLGAKIIYVMIPQRNTDLIRFIPAQNLIGLGKFREEANTLK